MKIEAEVQELFRSLFEVITPAGIQASNWRLFQGAVFGRDSLRVALDLWRYYPALARNVIVSLARLQGEKLDEMSEEEPGKIPHEFRSWEIGGVVVPAAVQRIMEELASRWGWRVPGKELCYYGSIDATPRFIALAARMAHHPDVLDLGVEFLPRWNQQIRTIQDSILNALDWLEAKLEQSSLHLLEYKRMNPRGHKWQVMRDGATSYMHPNGQLANADGGMAALEVQGYAYDALTTAAHLFEAQMPKRSTRWQEMAEELQRATIEQFWMADEQYFAMALDRDEQGNLRQVRTISSVAGDLLETALLGDLEEAERSIYIPAIVRRLYSPEFLTDVGIRSKSLRYLGTPDYWEYQGPCVSWPVMTNAFMCGLGRSGMKQLARDMAVRLINLYQSSESCHEFYFVTPDGRVGFQFSEDEGEVIIATNLPECTQAWTVSAMLGAIHQLQSNVTQGKDPFQALEQEIIESCGAEPLSREGTIDVRTRATTFCVDREEGNRREHELLRAQGYEY